MFTTSTSFSAVKPKLKQISTTHRVPRTFKIDNGPPFFFSKVTGFRHHKVIPANPKANVEVENVNKIIKKIARIEALSNKDYMQEIYNSLQV